MGVPGVVRLGNLEGGGLFQFGVRKPKENKIGGW